MNGKVAFIEYTYDPDITDSNMLESRLMRLGFQCVAENYKNKNYTLWIQGFSILLISQHAGSGKAGVTGLGIAVPDDIESSAIDPGIGQPVVNVNGFRYILLSDEHNSTEVLAKWFVVKEDAVISTLPGLLTSTRGIITGNDPEFVKSSLGFTPGKNTDECTEYVSADKSYSYIYTSNPNIKDRTIAIIDSDNVFGMVARCSDGSFNVVHNPNEVTDDFGDLTYKIRAYRCFARGNPETYNVEVCIRDVLPNFDMVVRTRRQYVGIDMSHFGYYI